MKIKMIKFISAVILLVISCSSDDKQAEVDKKITIDSSWYNVKNINAETYSFEEPNSSQGNVSYLLVGTSKALMFDTGSGENQPVNGYKIKTVIDQITQLPTTLLLSHFHFDHNQNISEFDNVGFPDIPFLREGVDENDIYTFTSEELFSGDYPSQVQVDEWLPVNTDIDLGNRIIQLVNIPGHTKESIAIIDKTNKLAFLGDYLYNGSLFLFDNEDVDKYKTSIDYLISILGNDYRLFGAHGLPEIAFSKLNTLKNFLICIQNENCEPTATTVWGYDVLLYEFENLNMVVFQ
ncbi:MBL fold metallo-hydrolase [Pontimicrobium sp. SW4]|uniref:MBL fold metallo-hydrolase n=1 Tax=Pontimicrobium sp. SW4 TaxID=3153519 RepID=A0AAU7BUW3_9FLAO